MCGNTSRERLEILEPVVEAWHAMVAFLAVRLEVKPKGSLNWYSLVQQKSKE